MFTKKQTQLELFSPEDAAYRKNLPAKPFWERFTKYEKSIIGAVFVIIIFIAAYSLGIEKGKRLIRAQGNALIKEQEALTEKPSLDPLLNNKNALGRIAPLNTGKETEPVKKDGFKKYTVQVASFKNKLAAEKEKKTLEKKGYDAHILAKKQFMVVCVGKFSDKGQASLSRKQLLKLYGDCLVREYN